MTKSKSPSLASVQGTRPPSGRRFILGFRTNETPRKNLISEPAVGFRMETILLAFRFFPSLFFQKSPSSVSFWKTCFIASKKDYITFLIFLSIPFPSFFNFFFKSLKKEGFFPPRSLGAQRNKTYHTRLKLSICPAAFFSVFSKKNRFKCNQIIRERNIGRDQT